MREGSFGMRWAALYDAAIAEACKPDATVDSVRDTARRFAGYRAEAGSLYAMYDTVQSEVDRAFEIADKHTDADAMRREFDKIYSGGGYFNYGMSQANEIVSKGLAVFVCTQGDPKEAIIAAVNFGRDTDCLAAVAGGLAGTLSGTAPLPDEWLTQVDEATAQDPYTNSKRTIDETADGLLDAYLARRAKLASLLDTMGDPALFR
jgi:ADP-ribosylglycohydrolase